jgi:molybdenum cofactor biosynthesis enzyme MoaA
MNKLKKIKATVVKQIFGFASIPYTAGIKNICFLGGEPFLRKGLLDLLSAIYTAGFSGIYIDRNGYEDGAA